MNLKKYIRTIPDFPKKGVMFRDVTLPIRLTHSPTTCGVFPFP